MTNPIGPSPIKNRRVETPVQPEGKPWHTDEEAGKTPTRPTVPLSLKKFYELVTPHHSLGQIKTNLTKEGFFKEDGKAAIPLAEKRILASLNQGEENLKKQFSPGSPEYKNGLIVFLLEKTEFPLLPLPKQIAFLKSLEPSPFSDEDRKQYIQLYQQQWDHPRRFAHAIKLEAMKQAPNDLGVAARLYKSAVDHNPTDLQLHLDAARAYQALANRQTHPVIKERLLKEALSFVMVANVQTKGGYLSIINLKNQLSGAIKELRGGEEIPATEKSQQAKGEKSSPKPPREGALARLNRLVQEKGVDSEKIPQALASGKLASIPNYSVHVYAEYAWANFGEFRKEIEEAFGKLPFNPDGSIQKSFLRKIPKPYLRKINQAAIIRDKAQIYLQYRAIRGMFYTFKILGSKNERQIEKAIQRTGNHFERAFALGRNWQEGRNQIQKLYYFASLLEKSGRDFAAKQIYLKGAQLLQASRQNFSTKEEGQVLRYLAAGYRGAGKLKEAIQTIESLLRSEKGSPQILQALKDTKREYDSNQKLGKVFFQKLSALEEKKRQGTISNAEAHQLNRIYHGLRLLRQVDQVSFPGQPNAPEYPFITQFRDEIIATLKKNPSDENLQKLDKTVTRLRGVEKVLKAAQKARIDLVNRLTGSTPYLQEYILRTGDYSVFRLTYPDGKGLPPEFRYELLDKQSYVKRFKLFRENSPSTAKSLEVRFKTLGLSGLIPSGINNMEALERAAETVAQDLFVVDPLTGKPPIGPKQTAVFRLHPHLQALIEGSQLVDRAENTVSFVQGGIKETSQQLQAIGSQLKRLHDFAKNQTELEKQKLEAHQKKNVRKEKYVDLQIAKNKKLNSMHLKGGETFVARFRQKLNEEQELLKGHLEKLKIPQNKFPLTGAIQTSLQVIQQIPKNFKTMQDYQKALQVIARHRALMLKGFAFLNGSMAQGWRPAQLAGSIESIQWHNKTQNLEKEVAVPPLNQPEDIASYLKTVDQYLKKTDQKLFQEFPKRLKEGIQGQIEFWRGVQKTFKERGDWVPEVETLLQTYQQANQELKNGNLLKAASLFRLAADSKRQSRVLQTYQSSNTRELLLDFAREITIITGAGLLSGFTAGALAPAGVARTAAGVARLGLRLRHFALSSTLFFGFEKLGRAWWYYGAGAGTDPLKDNKGRKLDALGFGYEYSKTALMFLILGGALKGYELATVGRRVAQRVTEESLGKLGAEELAKLGSRALVQDAIRLGSKMGGRGIEKRMLRGLIAQQTRAEIDGMAGLAKFCYRFGALRAELAGMLVHSSLTMGTDQLYESFRFGKKFDYSQFKKELVHLFSPKALLHNLATVLALKFAHIPLNPMQGALTSSKVMRESFRIQSDLFNNTRNIFVDQLHNNPNFLNSARAKAQALAFYKQGDKIFFATDGKGKPIFSEKQRKEWKQAKENFDQFFKINQLLAREEAKRQTVPVEATPQTEEKKPVPLVEVNGMKIKKEPGIIQGGQPKAKKPFIPPYQPASGTEIFVSSTDRLAARGKNPAAAQPTKDTTPTKKSKGETGNVIKSSALGPLLLLGPQIAQKGESLFGNPIIKGATLLVAGIATVGVAVYGIYRGLSFLSFGRGSSTKAKKSFSPDVSPNSAQAARSQSSSETSTGVTKNNLPGGEKLAGRGKKVSPAQRELAKKVAQQAKGEAKAKKYVPTPEEKKMIKQFSQVENRAEQAAKKIKENLKNLSPDVSFEISIKTIFDLDASQRKPDSQGNYFTNLKPSDLVKVRIYVKDWKSGQQVVKALKGKTEAPEGVAGVFNKLEKGKAVKAKVKIKTKSGQQMDITLVVSEEVKKADVQPDYETGGGNLTEIERSVIQSVRLAEHNLAPYERPERQSRLKAFTGIPGKLGEIAKDFYVILKEAKTKVKKIREDISEYTKVLKHYQKEAKNLERKDPARAKGYLEKAKQTEEFIRDKTYELEAIAEDIHNHEYHGIERSYKNAIKRIEPKIKSLRAKLDLINTNAIIEARNNRILKPAVEIELVYREPYEFNPADINTGFTTLPPDQFVSIRIKAKNWKVAREAVKKAQASLGEELGVPVTVHHETQLNVVFNRFESSGKNRGRLNLDFGFGENYKVKIEIAEGSSRGVQNKNRSDSAKKPDLRGSHTSPGIPSRISEESKQVKLPLAASGRGAPAAQRTRLAKNKQGASAKATRGGTGNVLRSIALGPILLVAPQIAEQGRGLVESPAFRGAAWLMGIGLAVGGATYGIYRAVRGRRSTAKAETTAQKPTFPTGEPGLAARGRKAPAAEQTPRAQTTQEAPAPKITEQGAKPPEGTIPFVKDFSEGGKEVAVLGNREENVQRHSNFFQVAAGEGNNLIGNSQARLIKDVQGKVSLQNNSSGPKGSEVWFKENGVWYRIERGAAEYIGDGYEIALGKIRSKSETGETTRMIAEDDVITDQAIVYRFDNKNNRLHLVSKSKPQPPPTQAGPAAPPEKPDDLQQNADPDFPLPPRPTDQELQGLAAHEKRHAVKDMLKDPNLTPVAKVDIQNPNHQTQTFYFTRIIRVTSRDGEESRLYAFAIVPEIENGRTVLKRRFFYKSISGGGWRASPYKSGGHIMKGQMQGMEGNDLATLARLGVRHYVAETQPVPEIVKALEALEQAATPKNKQDTGRFLEKDENFVNGYIESEGQHLQETGRGIPLDAQQSMYLGFGQRTKYADTPSLSEFQKVKPGSAFKGIGDPVKTIEKLKNFKYPEGFIPNFRADPVAVRQTRHPILGEVVQRDYGGGYLIDKKGKRREVVWTMAEEKVGSGDGSVKRAWVHSIRFKDAPVNSYGVPGEVIDGGILVYKPTEYKTQADALFGSPYVSEIPGNDRYVDITPATDVLKPNELYREARGITPPPVKMIPKPKLKIGDLLGNGEPLPGRPPPIERAVGPQSPKKIIALGGNEKNGWTIPVRDTKGKPIIIGRDPQTSGGKIQLKDPSISRQHAKIHIENGVYRLEPFKKSNGEFALTKINGKRVEQDTRTGKWPELRSGDLVTFGGRVFKFIFNTENRSPYGLLLALNTDLLMNP